jgi:hypothetical protein
MRRAAHPATVLGWLRNGVLLGATSAALLYLWVAIQARHDIDAASRTTQAIHAIAHVSGDAKAAQGALVSALANGDVTSTGTGPDYVTNIIHAGEELALTADGNAADPKGTSDVQHVSRELETYLELSESAAIDYGSGAGHLPEAFATAEEGDVQSGLSILRGDELEALRTQRGAWPLDPGTFWWALLGPVIGVLLLAAATVRVLSRHFRRHVSRWLWCSLAVTAVTTVTTGFFNVSDERQLSADPWAGHPATLTVALLLYLTAGVLAYFAYRPRLAEYRFQPS